MAEGDLVTGGAGFIGSHLVETLLARGRRVTVIDDLSTGERRNVAHLEESDGLGGPPGSRFNLICGSILDGALVRGLVDEHERVFHLAAAVGVRLVIDRPVRTIETNAFGTSNVLRAAAAEGKPCLITSTSETYGKSTDLPFREGGDLVLGPSVRRRWAYACSKLLDEFLALAHRIETGLPVVIARLFNTIGPRQTGRYGMVVPTFVSQALRGEPLTVYGDGNQKRCFADVADVVPALADLLDCAVEGKGAAGEVVNLGGTRPVTINELARLVIEVTGSSSGIAHVPYEEAYPEGFEDMHDRWPDVSKAKRLVGFEPKVELGETIARLAERMRSEGRA